MRFVLCDWGDKYTYSLTGDKGMFLIFVTRKFPSQGTNRSVVNSTVQRRPLGFQFVLNWALSPVETNECALVRCRVGIMTYIQKEWWG